MPMPSMLTRPVRSESLMTDEVGQVQASAHPSQISQGMTSAAKAEVECNEASHSFRCHKFGIC